MHTFGQADVFEPEVTGEPGQRTFRVLVQRGGESASLLLEKEQMAALALAIRQLLEQTQNGEPKGEEAPSARSLSFPAQPDIEIRLARLGIGYDESTHLVTIFAYDIEDVNTEADADDDDEEQTPSFSCQATRGQCRAFATNAEEMVEAGRPVCLLCGGPIEDGEHLCRRRNGHSQRPRASR